MGDGDGFALVATLDELEEAVPLERGRIALVRLGGRVFAFRSACPHMAERLARGSVDARAATIRCAQHHWTFRLTDGACVFAGDTPLPVYPVRVRDGGVWVRELPTEY